MSLDWDGAVSTGGTAAALLAPLRCALQMGSAVVWGLGWWLPARAQTRWLPLAPLTPHMSRLPTTAWGCGWEQGWTPGLLQHWVCLTQHVCEAMEGPACKHSIPLCACEGDCCHQHPCLGSPCAWGDLGRPLTAARGPPSSPGVMQKSVMPGEGWAAGTSWCEQVASRCVTSVTGGPFPEDAAAPRPTAWPQAAPCLAWHRSLLAGTEGHAAEPAGGSRAVLAQPSPRSCCNHVQQLQGGSSHGMSLLRAGSHLALSRCPHPITASLPGQLTAPGDLCPLAITVARAATKLLSGKAPYIPVARGGGTGGESCPQPRERGKLGAATASWWSANAGEKSLSEALGGWWSHRRYWLKQTERNSYKDD